MFEIDKSFAHANISRTIRFTEPLFYELKALAEKENMSFNNIGSTPVLVDRSI